MVFTMHGAQKLFVMGIGGVEQGFVQMGIPMPNVTAPLVGGLEFFGGLALTLGLLTRLVSVGLLIDMLGALYFVHLAQGFFLPRGFEFVMLLGVCAAGFAVSGAGMYSVDTILRRRRGDRVGSTTRRYA